MGFPCTSRKILKFSKQPVKLKNANASLLLWVWYRTDSKQYLIWHPRNLLCALFYFASLKIPYLGRTWNAAGVWFCRQRSPLGPKKSRFAFFSRALHYLLHYFSVLAPKSSQSQYWTTVVLFAHWSRNFLNQTKSISPKTQKNVPCPHKERPHLFLDARCGLMHVRGTIEQPPTCLSFCTGKTHRQSAWTLTSGGWVTVSRRNPTISV